MAKILTVFGTRDGHFSTEVIMALHNRLDSQGIEFINAVHAAEAKQKILRDHPVDLIIVHINIPIDGDSTDADEMQGLVLLRELYDQGNHIPAILFAPSNTPELSAQANELLNCYVLDLMKACENWQDVLINRARIVLEHNTGYVMSRDEIEAVNVDITIGTEEKSTDYWTVTFSVVGGGPVKCKPVVIPVDSEQIQLLSSLTRTLESMVDVDNGPIRNWNEPLEQIGQQLGTVLLKNVDFKNRYDILRGMGGGLDKFHIRFYVGKGAPPFVWEALAERKDKACNYWMLKAPIYRTFWTSRNVTVYEPPLFEKYATRPNNCLIIESDIGENYVGCIDKEYSLLENIQDEVAFLAGYLPGLNCVGRVRKIPEKGEICTRTLVEECLTKDGPWDIVHYAGHSYFGRYLMGKDGLGGWSDEKTGLLFFPGEEDGAVDHVTCELFSKWLRDARTKFIYLSSCHSSEESFLYELADRGIPSALGFRWDIKDDLARDHAEQFYKHLMACRSLEYAFLKTRQDMYNAYQKKTIWAAPVLILQT